MNQIREYETGGRGCMDVNRRRIAVLNVNMHDHLKSKHIARKDDFNYDAWIYNRQGFVKPIQLELLNKDCKSAWFYSNHSEIWRNTARK